jgi:hypothetical protein
MRKQMSWPNQHLHRMPEKRRMNYVKPKQRVSIAPQEIT